MSIPNKTNTVLYLTYDGLTDHIGQSQILPYLLSCSKAGIAIHILSFEKAGRDQQINQVQRQLEEQGIIWHRMSFTEGRGLSYKLYDFVRFIRKAFSVSRTYRYAIVHSRSYFASSIGLLIAKRRQAKLIFDKRDFWIDAIVETNRLRPSLQFSHKIVHNILRYFERQLFHKATHIVSLTHKAKDIVLKKYPRDPGEITVIPCCVDLDLFNPAHISPDDIKAKRAALGIPHGATVFGYVGSIGAAYKVPELLQCFSVIKQRLADAKLLFLVNNDPSEVYRLAETNGIAKEDIIVTSAPRSEVPLHIALIDYGLFFIMPTFAKQATSPTKQYEMLAMGKALITNNGVGDAEKVFNDLHCGYLVADFNEQEYALAADWVAQHHGKQAPFDLSHYSLQWGAAKYLGVYKQLLGQ